MPLLKLETDLFPPDLLDDSQFQDSPWWAFYTLARQEKKLMRQLLQRRIPFYAPVIERRYRSPNGRLRKSYEPLFGNYVFVCGSDEARYEAVSTGSVSRCFPVPGVDELRADLRQIRELITLGASLSPESRIESGQRVRIRNGSFAGFEGIVFHRQGDTRLFVAVRFMEQGVSVALTDCQVDPI